MPGSIDFRDNLIVDRNNPVLVQKAWRDYDKRGWAHLGVPHGEDALTWNVFRSLDLDPAGREVIQAFFGLASPVEEVLFWSCDPDGEAEAQQTLGILLRGLDGQQGGTMTEPDLVILTTAEVCFVECKAKPSRFPWVAKAPRPGSAGAGTVAVEGEEEETEKGEAEGAPTEGQPEDEKGWTSRWRAYRADDRIGMTLPRTPTTPDWAVYQLVRNAVYARLLARELRKERAMVVSLVSRLQWALFPATTEEQYAHFRARCGDIVGDLRFWEDLQDLLPDGPAAKLAQTVEAMEALIDGDISARINMLRSKTPEKRRASETTMNRLRAGLLLPHAANLVTCLGISHAADIQGTVSGILAAMSAAALPALVQGLAKSNTERRLACLELLTRLGPAAAGAAPTLQALVATPKLSTAVKAAARDALAAMAAPPPVVGT
jgi:hypothetical protein